MKQIHRITILLVLLAFFMSVTVAFTTHYRYVSSEYSKYCYKSDNVHHNIKNRLYYETLEECNKPLKI